jgi:type IV secretion system protein VirB3
MNQNEGFFIPFHRSLTETILLAGVPRTPAYLLWTLTIALGFGLQQIWVIPFGIAIHFLLVAVTKNDPFFFDIFVNAMKNPQKIVP